MKNFFSEKDSAQIIAHGQTIENILVQMRNFRNGFGFLNIDRVAVRGDGIMTVDEKRSEFFSKEYAAAAPGLRIVKFVPASGAATRMFKELFEFIDNGKQSEKTESLIKNIEEFALYDTIKGDIAGNDPKAIVKAVLEYGAQLPKALILFHKYPGETRTAAEEHLVEGAMYASAAGSVNIHFTVSKEHLDGFKKLLEKAIPKYEERFGVKYNISFSQQSPGTDTIAVTPENAPFREDDGSLLFRPAGHGALLENLNAIDADIIFIKNIDNVTTDKLKDETVRYKMVLAGILVSLQKKIFNYLGMLDLGTNEAACNNIAKFIKEDLSYEFPSEFASMSEKGKAEMLRNVLNRPLRVCAMVPNEGEAGGGPFWTINADGSKSLQIAEPSQIAPEKQYLLKEGTHFNPADLVCAVKDYKGNKFDLTKFVDPATGFISEKSKNGRPLRALELPGLWNGSMANWNTVFVEVPVSTFTPVKEIADLLRPQHR